jgi:phosphoribosylanthranilate isomerase
MTLKYCSVTGADDAVNAKDLAALGARYPFAEWAILLLPARAGLPRFPKPEWIEDFSAGYQGHKAMHLCDAALLDFIAQKPETLALMKGFSRIQLNLKFGEMDGKYDPAELVARIKAAPQWQFIIQYGKDKSDLLPLLADVPNHAVLFDDSAGRGITPDSWPAPLEGHFCGYAGGLTPDNLKQNIDIILQAAAGKDTWIDMETGVRTDDVFDLAKVEKVLEITSGYIK